MLFQLSVTSAADPVEPTACHTCRRLHTSHTAVQPSSNTNPATRLHPSQHDPARHDWLCREVPAKLPEVHGASGTAAGNARTPLSGRTLPNA